MGLIFSGFFLAEQGIKIAELGAAADIFLNKVQCCLVLTENVRTLAVFTTAVAIIVLIQLIAA